MQGTWLNKNLEDFSSALLCEIEPGQTHATSVFSRVFLVVSCTICCIYRGCKNILFVFLQGRMEELGSGEKAGEIQRPKSERSNGLVQPFGFAYDLSDMPRIVAVHTLDREKERAKEWCTIVEIFTQQSCCDDESNVWPRINNSQDSSLFLDAPFQDEKRVRKLKKAENQNEKMHARQEDIAASKRNIDKISKPNRRMAWSSHNNNRHVDGKDAKAISSRKWYEEVDDCDESSGDDYDDAQFKWDYDDKEHSFADSHSPLRKSESSWGGLKSSQTFKNYFNHPGKNRQNLVKGKDHSEDQFISLDSSMDFINSKTFGVEIDREQESDKYYQGCYDNYDEDHSIGLYGNDDYFQASPNSELENTDEAMLDAELNTGKRKRTIKENVMEHSVSFLNGKSMKDNIYDKGQRDQVSPKVSFVHLKKHLKKRVMSFPRSRSVKINN